MRPTVTVIVFALTLAFLCLVTNGSPVLTSDTSDHAKMIVKRLSQVMEQSFDSLNHAQHATARLMVMHGVPASRVHIDRPNRKLHQEEPKPASCASASSDMCRAISPELTNCFLAVFNNPDLNLNGGFFALPTFLCQLSSSNSSCAATLITYVKTCACVDYQPLFNLACPTAPTASACSKQASVQEFIALNTNSSEGFFGGLMNMGSMFGPNMGSQPDLTMCGDALLYRTTTMINNLGACLYDIVNAIPLPTFATPPGGMNMRDMYVGSFKCALTMPSYRLQALCSGNVAKCYSALQSPSSNLGSCGTLSAGTCPVGCSAQLATFGATTSSPACCVRWFQGMADATPCSETPSITMTTMMGPECLNMMKLMASMCTGDQCPSPDMLNMYTSMPIFPAACSAGSPASKAVKNCNVATTNLSPACAPSSAPYVQSSVFAPLKTTTATLSFASTGLSQVQMPV
jgi:hypothetical protein